MSLTPLEQKEIAEQFAKDNIVECCRELLESCETGIIGDGKFRELSRLCKFVPGNSLGLAETLVKNEAVRLIAERD